MAIDYASFFTKLGKQIDAYKKLLLAVGGTTDTEFQQILDSYASESRAVLSTIEGTIQQLSSLQSSVSSQVSSLLTQPMSALLVELVKEDTGKTVSRLQALDELIRQMKADGESVESSTVGSSVSGTTTGSGSKEVSLVNVDGNQAELAYAEDINIRLQGSGVGQSYLVIGDEGYSRFNKDYPGGSGIRATKRVANPSESGNIIQNGTIETPSITDTTVPNGWISTASTTAEITSVQEVELAISGTPTGGSYNIEITDADGKKLVTAPIAYNALAGSIQQAVQALPGYEDTTVIYQTGTTPNYVFQIYFYNRANGNVVTVQDNTTGGSALFTITVDEAGGNYLSGGRALKLTGDGSEKVVYYIPVKLSTRTAYFASVRLRPDTVTSGAMKVSLVDQFEAVTDPLTDNAGSDNAYDTDISALTDATFYAASGFFRTANELPSATYLKIEMTTAIDGSGVVEISDVLLKPTTPVYPGGPYIELTDLETEWAKDDRLVVTVSNDYSGELHQWLNRIFNLKASGRLFPTSGSPTRADSLIS